MGFFPGCLENRLKAEEIEDEKMRRWDGSRKWEFGSRNEVAGSQEAQSDRLMVCLELRAKPNKQVSHTSNFQRRKQ
jgi:hypothetical protein